MNGTPASAARLLHVLDVLLVALLVEHQQRRLVCASVRAAISRRAVVVLPAPVAPNSTTCCPAPIGSRGPRFAHRGHRHVRERPAATAVRARARPASAGTARSPSRCSRRGLPDPAASELVVAKLLAGAEVARSPARSHDSRRRSTATPAATGRAPRSMRPDRSRQRARAHQRPPADTGSVPTKLFSGEAATRRQRRPGPGASSGRGRQRSSPGATSRGPASGQVPVASTPASGVPQRPRAGSSRPARSASFRGQRSDRPAAPSARTRSAISSSPQT